ncbi:hypothetical protein HKCCE2091_07450 [Rhodobacterales bacterium HKCCE2091]|nr:hypothetical protein [Rhodobacterales bacterium HKCCE2091]
MTSRPDQEPPRRGFAWPSITCSPAQTMTLIWAVGSMTLAMTGPFGTFDVMDPLHRYLYWPAVTGLAILAALGSGRLVRRRLKLSGSRADLVAAALMSVVFGPTLWMVNRVLDDVDGWAVPNLAIHVAVVFNLGLGVALLRHRARERVAEQVGASGLPLPRRLASEIGADVVHARADGHYMEVERPSGSARLLMRFSDALEALAALDGAQVHRSHWVARAAVARTERDGRRTFVVLRSGKRVPVSRRYEDALPRLLDGD